MSASDLGAASHEMADIEPGLRLHYVTAGQGPRTAALLYCDMTVDSTGADITVEQRLDDIQRNQGSDHVVTRFVTDARAGCRGPYEHCDNPSG